MWIRPCSSLPSQLQVHSSLSLQEMMHSVTLKLERTVLGSADQSIFGSNYNLNLRSITISGETVDIDPKVFASGGTFIDSRTSLSILAEKAYDQLISFLTAVVSRFAKPVFMGSILCFQVFGIRRYDYNVNLQSISVNGKVVQVDPAMFESKNGGATLVDSGTTLTVLAETAYEPVISSLTAVVSQHAEPITIGPYQCFTTSSRIDEIFPLVSFNMEGGKSMLVEPKNYMIRQNDSEDSGAWCIGFLKIAGEPRTILGGYRFNDLPESTIRFYYIKVKIGSPPRDFNLVIDTGSDITWMSCEPCDGCPTVNKFGIQLSSYSLNGSTSTSQIPCSDKFCQTTKSTCSSPSPVYIYSIKYEDTSETRGYYLSDTFHLVTIMNGSATYSSTSVVFGCSNYQSRRLDSDTMVDGILGLGHLRSSIISQLSSRGVVPKVFTHYLRRDNGGIWFLVKLYNLVSYTAH